MGGCCWGAPLKPSPSHPQALGLGGGGWRGFARSFLRTRRGECCRCEGGGFCCLAWSWRRPCEGSRVWRARAAHTYGAKPCAAASQPSSALRPAEERAAGIAGEEGRCRGLPRCVSPGRLPSPRLRTAAAPKLSSRGRGFARGSRWRGDFDRRGSVEAAPLHSQAPAALDAS